MTVASKRVWSRARVLHRRDDLLEGRMDAVKLRNPQAELEYFRWRKRWSDAGKKLHLYDEQSLKFIWFQLESAWRRVGYCFGDRREDENGISERRF